jgi:hypothetical protein
MRVKSYEGKLSHIVERSNPLDLADIMPKVTQLAKMLETG